MLRAYTTRHYYLKFLFNQCLLGSSMHFQLQNIFHSTLFSLQEVYFVRCIKCDQFETKNIAKTLKNKALEMAAKTANYCFVNVLFIIHPILFNHSLFSICFDCWYIKTQLISTALWYKVEQSWFCFTKVGFCGTFLRCDTAYWKQWIVHLVL